MPTSRLKLPLVATVIAFSAIVIMFALGFWQLDRKGEKELRIENIAKAANSDILSLPDVVVDLPQFEDYVVTGSGLASDKLFYIDNKLHNGKPGFNVLVPYKTEVGTFLLNLGWVPSQGIRSALPVVDIPDLSAVKGIVYIPTINKLVTETNTAYGAFPVLLQQVDMDEIAKHLSVDVLPAVIRLLPDNSKFIRDWQVVTMSPDKHLAYAIQWFGLGVAALTIYLLSMLKWMNGPTPLGKSEDETK